MSDAVDSWYPPDFCCDTWLPLLCEMEGRYYALSDAVLNELIAEYSRLHVAVCDIESTLPAEQLVQPEQLQYAMIGNELTQALYPEVSNALPKIQQTTPIALAEKDKGPGREETQGQPRQIAEMPRQAESEVAGELIHGKATSNVALVMSDIVDPAKYLYDSFGFNPLG